MMNKNIFVLMDEYEENFEYQMVIETSLDRAELQEIIQEVKETVEYYTMEDLEEELIKRGVYFDIRKLDVVLF